MLIKAADIQQNEQFTRVDSTDTVPHIYDKLMCSGEWMAVL